MTIQAIKTGSLRAVLALTLGVSISSLANASRLETQTAATEVLAVSDVSAPIDQMMYDVMKSEIMLASLLIEDSTALTAKFAGVEHATVVTITP